MKDTKEGSKIFGAKIDLPRLVGTAIDIAASIKKGFSTFKLDSMFLKIRHFFIKWSLF